VKNQVEADALIPQALRDPADLWVCMVGPMEGPVDLNSRECLIDKRRFKYTLGNYLDWVICFGGSKPVHPDWVRSLRDQCQAAGVPFMFTGWGEWADAEAVGIGSFGPRLNRDGDYKDYFDQDVVLADGITRARARAHRFDPAKCFQVFRVGSKRSGRILDGQTWDQRPEAPHGS